MPQLHTVVTPAKGVVDPATAQAMFRMERYLPSPALAPFLDHYWVVEWDLCGRPPHTQRTLPYPCVNVVFDRGRTAVFGVVTGAFDYVLQERGRVLGLRFRAGGFRAFLGKPLVGITDRAVPLSTVFGGDDAACEARVLGALDDAAMVAAADALLLPHLPAADPMVERIGAVLRLAAETGSVTQAGELAERSGMRLRAMQNMFREYVGVSPKWVIRRYRLHDAAAALAGGDRVDLAALAQSLGYFDQAHFSADFQRLVGQSPAQYRRANGLG